MKTDNKSNYKKEVFEALGGEDEKEGIKAAQEYKEIHKQEVKEYSELEQEKLWDQKKQIETYKDFLVGALLGRMRQIDWPVGFRLWADHTKRGVRIIIQAPNGSYYARGFTPVHAPLYDLNAVEVLAMQAENTVVKLSSKKEEIWKPGDL